MAEVTASNVEQVRVRSAQRRTQSERSAESRHRLVQAAIELLATNGYSGTTLVEIGKRAGLSRGLVSFHFGSKEQIMLAVVDSIRESVSGLLLRPEGVPRGMEAVASLIDTYLIEDPAGNVRIRAIYVIITESVTSAPGLRPAVAANNSMFRDLLIERLQEAYEDEGAESSRSNLDALSTLIEGMLRGIVIQHLADPDAVSLKDVAATAKEAVRSYVRSTS